MIMTTEEKAVKETSDRLFARIRKSDDVLREHFSKVKDGDRAYEIRRLLEKAILAERDVK